MIYLDNAATTRIDPRVYAKMEPWLKEKFGNPSAQYGLGREAKAAIELAREEIAEVVGCLPEEIIFTSGGTEANNIALLGIREKRWIASSRIEHPSVWNILGHYSSRDFVPVKESGIVANTLRARHDRDYDIVTLMAVNNETGVRQPFEDFAEWCSWAGVPFHIDAVQAFGKIKLDLKNVDTMSVSAHKFNGPKGIGFLYKNLATDRAQLMYGGHQENGFRPGTENVAAIVGMAEAVKIHSDPKPLNLGWFEDMLVEIGAVINGISCHEDKWKRIINCRFSDIHNGTLMRALDEMGIFIGTGSACNSSLAVPSRVLKAMGLTDEQCNQSIRLSPDESFTKGQAKEVIEAIQKIRRESHFVDSI